MKKLEDKKTAILVANGFEQDEMTKPYQALKEAGVPVYIISPEKKIVKGWKNNQWAQEFPVDVHLDDANSDDYDALILPGGVMNPDHLRTIPQAIKFIASFAMVGKPIAAICHGPWTLINANGVKGRILTSWPSLKEDITNAGGTWIDKEVVIDGNLVTSRKPEDIPAFNKAIIQLIKEH